MSPVVKAQGFTNERDFEMVTDNGIALWSRKGQELLEVSGGQRHGKFLIEFSYHIP